MISPDFASKALVGMGLSRLARSSRDGQGCVLTFHGVRDQSFSSKVLDEDLHITQSMFREVCRHLAENYRVVPLSEITKAVTEGLQMPAATVAITFDDGYESNYALAYPVLKEFSLPATIFLTTGFLDGTDKLWFNSLELAVKMSALQSVDVEIEGKVCTFPLGTTVERASTLGTLLATAKAYRQEDLPEWMTEVKGALGVGAIGYDQYPAPLLPMKWDQAREMQDSGLVDFGGHTHRHPILGRCTVERARDEIFRSRDRITAELGAAPTQFAYTNGKQSDFNADTQALLREAGYHGAYTMEPGFIKAGDDAFALPRYGAPSSVAQAEVTVSGTFDALHNIKQACKRAFAA